MIRDSTKVHSFVWLLPAILINLSCAPQGAKSDDAGLTWQLVWSDEFDGDSVDESKWSFQIGDGCNIGLCGWGNNELQWYTNENATVADGLLTIEAREEETSGYAYTSSRMRSLSKGDWTYGRFEIRAALPVGQGLWPAIWMLPSENKYGTWAASGEIDITEAVGHQPDRVNGTIHYGGRWPDNEFKGNTHLFEQSDISEFHTYSIEWEENEIRWYVDDTFYGKQTKWNTSGGDFPAPFDQDFHMLLNVAVGGNWPGSPDSTTMFPQTMKVDFVRVYERR